MRFTVRRPPTGEVSPCGHRPPGGDIACSVDVGVAPSSSAGFALEDRLALAVSRSDVPARGTTLRRTRSRDSLNPAKSLVVQSRNEQAPAALADRAIEPALLSRSYARLLDGATRRACHRPHIKGLDSNHVKPPCKVGAGLLHPVLTPVPLAGSQFRNRPFRLLAAFGTTRGTGEPPLQYLQPLRLTRSKTGCMQQFAGRHRSRYDNTTVNADHAAIARAADRVWYVRECDMPAASPITDNPVRFDTLGHRSRQPKPHPSDLRHPYPAEAAVQLLDVTCLHSDLSKTFVNTGFAPRRAAVCATEKVPHSLREISQRLLLHRLASGPKPRVVGAGLRQLRGLLNVVGSLAPRLPVLLLLHRQIPDIPRIPAMRYQPLLLLRGWQQSKPRHTRTVTGTTDNLAPSTAAPLGVSFLPQLKSRVSSGMKHP